eukprot:GHVU01019331.1.p1 GENE.GHVU01019331.1~~GHVU01019331.1.p1  ORF type:complete len:355 (-),score=52.22 GHVU01019331.1:1358-2422(-)
MRYGCHRVPPLPHVLHLPPLLLLQHVPIYPTYERTVRPLVGDAHAQVAVLKKLRKTLKDLVDADSVPPVTLQAAQPQAVELTGDEAEILRMLAGGDDACAVSYPIGDDDDDEEGLLRPSRTAEERRVNRRTEVTVGQYSVKLDGLCERLRRLLGVQFHDSMKSLDEEQSSDLMENAAEAVLYAMDELRALEQELQKIAVPTYPWEFKVLKPSQFQELLTEVTPMLTAAFPDELTGESGFLAKVTEEHGKLFQGTEGSKPQTKQSMKKAWEPLLETMPHLAVLGASLATIFPGNADVERDFAIMKWLLSDKRDNLGVMGLVGSLLCMQIDRVRQVSRCVVAGRSRVDTAVALLRA